MTTEELRLISSLNGSGLNTKLAEDWVLGSWQSLRGTVRTIESELSIGLEKNHHATITQYEIMSALIRVRDGLTLEELTDWLQIPKITIRSIIERLLAKELSRREADLVRSRSFVLNLTKKGKLMFIGMESAYDKLVLRFWTKFVSEEDMSLGTFLTRIKSSDKQSTY